MKSLIASICILGLVGMVVGVAVQGADTASVGATVTVQNISVSVSDGTVAYGAIAAGASKNTALYNGSTNPNGMDPADTQTAKNEGNVNVTLNIRGTTSSGGWTLATTAAGATEYRHAFSKDSFATEDIPLTLSNQDLAVGVAIGNSQTFDLRITTPPSATNYTEQSVNVIVQASI